MGLFSFLFGGGNKQQTQNSTTNTVTAPWAPTIPYLQQFLGDTSNLYSTAPDFSPQEQAASANLFDTVGHTADVLNPAIAANNSAAAGDYLTPETNPYLADIAKRISGIAGAGSNATFGGRGRTSSGLSGYYNGQAVGNSLTDMYGGQYNAERGRQMQAIGQAPALSGAMIEPAKAAVEAGANISNRPFQRNLMQGGLLGSIAGLGGQSTSNTNGTLTYPSQSTGLLGGIINKMFSSNVFGSK